MITENYVSFEVAKLLKEKGFDEPVYRGISINNLIFVKEEPEDFNHKLSAYCSQPTLQMAMKWLEEVHHILVVADYIYECTDTSWVYKIYRLGENGKPERVEITGVGYSIDGSQYTETVGYRDYELSFKDYATREEAEDEGIQYCLVRL